MKHFFMIVFQQRQFEAILGRVKCNGSGARRSIQAMDNLALDTGEVDGVIKSTYDAMVAGSDNKLPP